MKVKSERQPRILDFKSYLLEKKVRELLEELRAYVYFGDIIHINQITAELIRLRQVSLPLIIQSLKKHALLEDWRIVEVLKEILMQVGAPALSVLREHLNHDDQGVVAETLAELFVGELVDNYFSYRAHEIDEPDYHARQMALVREIAQIGKPLVPRLIRGLLNANIREYLVIALGEIGDRRATPILAALLRKQLPSRSNTERPIYQWVARALGEIGDERAVGALVEFLGREVSSGKIEAAEALEKILGRRFGNYRRYGNDLQRWRRYQKKVVQFLQQIHPKGDFNVVTRGKEA